MAQGCRFAKFPIIAAIRRLCPLLPLRRRGMLRGLAALGVALSVTGCGGYVARRMVQAPNTYPSWLAPQARVILAFDDKLLTHFPTQEVEVGPPPARLQYRIIPPADYRLTVTSSNWTAARPERTQYNFAAEVPGATNAWSRSPRGTVVLLHGYGEAQFAMLPWALLLAEHGWQTVLVDLRGHGASSGERIFFGVREANDLRELLDELTRHAAAPAPVAVLGESYGAALALRWKTTDPRVGRVVAIAPYAVLSNAVLNICAEYAPCLPRIFPKAGLKQLPRILGVEPAELNPIDVLTRDPVAALFIAGAEDDIAPPADVGALFAQAAPRSTLLTVAGATHETLPYHFDALAQPVLDWLADRPASPPGGR
jgi:alpha-beta hydrolase superfamily lysophospholipase